jgi:hypothetical protein
MAVGEVEKQSPNSLFEGLFRFSRNSAIKAACLQIIANFHENFENVFKSKNL